MDEDVPPESRPSAESMSQTPLPDHTRNTLYPSGPALEAARDKEPLIQRKPVLPPRSSRQSLDKRSYNIIEMEQMQKPKTAPTEKENLAREYPLPKAFRKTHLFYGFDLGYWRMPARHASIFIPLALLTLIPIYLVSTHYEITTVVFGPFEYDCYGTSSGWSFVGINIRYGTFTYGGAKAVDLAWNWVVGRGLQGAFTWVAYRVFNDALLRTAEMIPLSYELYASLSLYSTKPDILWQLLKGLRKRGNWRTKAIFIWLLISTIYLVIFPSLLDACSGYEVSYTTLFKWPNGTLQNATDLNYWDRNDTIMSSVAVCGTWSVASNGTFFNYTYQPFGTQPSNSSANNISVENCVTSNSENVRQTTQKVFYWTDPVVNQSWWDNFKTDPWGSQMSDKYSWKDWHFYPTLSTSFRCSTEGSVYQWGFSFEWLFIVVIINSVWLFGLWVLWLDCDTNSELCKKGRRLGLWRAVADISEALREELGPDICAYSEQELADALNKRPPVKYYVKQGTSEEPGHIGLSSRASGRFKLKWNQEYGQSRDRSID